MDRLTAEGRPCGRAAPESLLLFHHLMLVLLFLFVPLTVPRKGVQTAATTLAATISTATVTAALAATFSTATESLKLRDRTVQLVVTRLQ